jgi:hypothetical protein
MDVSLREFQVGFRSSDETGRAVAMLGPKCFDRRSIGKKAFLCLINGARVGEESGTKDVVTQSARGQLDLRIR